MIDRAVDLVIADAGPLIPLDELAALDLLSDFPRVLIPDAVWREVERYRPLALAAKPFIRIESGPLDPRVATLAMTFTLHRGEREALSLAAHFPKAMFLTNDTAARLAAQTFTQRVHGTLGLLVRAMRRGQRSRDEVLVLLRAIPLQSSLHIRPALLNEVIAQVEAEGQ
jgi:predicted nucleic acid-binding protein